MGRGRLRRDHGVDCLAERLGCAMKVGGRLRVVDGDPASKVLHGAGETRHVADFLSDRQALPEQPTSPSRIPVGQGQVR